MHGGWGVLFRWSGVLLFAAGLAGCQAGGSDETSAATAVQMLEGEEASVVTPAAAASERPEVDEDVFTGTNLLQGAWAKLEESAQPEPADNSYCYVCHANYQEEELTKFHLPMGVGCELCHGMSDEHSADEDGLTPPEIMWPKPWINVTCMECHPYEELAKEHSHEEFLAKTSPEQVCTECHGKEHRLSVRTRVWDRETGKLTDCDGVRMMDADSPAGAAR